MITAEEARSVWAYEKGTGVLRWKVQRAGIVPGMEAGSVHSEGYVLVKYKRKSYKAHRLAWLIHTGEWPKGQIDHRNGVRSDNSIANLRQCDNGENQQNRKLASNNSTGFTGVMFKKREGKFFSRIRVGGRRLELGTYETAEAAHEAYLLAKSRLHKFNPEPALRDQQAKPEVQP